MERKAHVYWADFAIGPVNPSVEEMLIETCQLPSALPIAANSFEDAAANTVVHAIGTKAIKSQAGTSVVVALHDEESASVRLIEVVIQPIATRVMRSRSLASALCG